VLQDSYELMEYATDDDDLEWFDESTELADVLRDALSDDFADASPDEMDDALSSVLESMSPAESFNFAKALKQIGRGASKALSDPTVGQVLRTALPAAGGALGAVIGGPLGTSLGSKLGSVAAGALPGAPKAPTVAAPATPVVGGSAAAAQGLVLTQQPDVLQSLLALAMGEHGQKSVNGIPVATIMGMLSSVFGQAAADADELMYLEGEDLEDFAEAFEYDSDEPPGRSLYTTLMDAENDELAEAWESS